MDDRLTCICRVEARSVLPPTWQGYDLSLPDSKFYYVEKGAIVVEIYGETLTAGPGDLLLIPAHTPHSCYLTKEAYAEKSWCHFEMKSGAADFFESYTIPPLLHVADRAHVKRLFRSLIDARRLPAAQRSLAASAALCGLVRYYFDHTAPTPRVCVDDRIRRVATYIEEHYPEPLTLEALARLAGYSAVHFSKRFRECTGLPPMRYLNNVRIEQAKYLLQFTDEPVNRIMEKIGFTDPAYFSRFFKKTLGYPPQAYRQLYRLPTVHEK